MKGAGSGWDRNAASVGLQMSIRWEPLPSSLMKSIDEFKSKSRAIFEQVDPKFGEYFQIMMDEGSA